MADLLRAARFWKSRGGMAMAKETKKLDDLFHDTLKDIYFAENLDEDCGNRRQPRSGVASPAGIKKPDREVGLKF
jgi:hypothetical protein